MKMLSLEGKVAIITGGARGIGAAIGRDFAARGAHVALTDILEEVGQATADEIGDSALFLKHDVRDEEAWMALSEESRLRG